MYDHVRIIGAMSAVIGFLVGACLGFYYLMYAATTPVGF